MVREQWRKTSSRPGELRAQLEEPMKYIVGLLRKLRSVQIDDWNFSLAITSIEVLSGNSTLKCINTFIVLKVIFC